MIKASRISLLFILALQLTLMPVSQAFAVQYMHKNGNNESSSTSQIPASRIVEYYKITNNPTVSEVTIHQHSQKSFKKTQCAREYGHKEQCSSCLCISIIVAPAISFPVLRFTPTKNYLELSYPLHSIFMLPPFRPPIV